ncbi:alginate O-acetyltransferase AlgX-related protein [Clostridium algidicarnis]|uniref:alginate O-acetyltransferase AlgX-related protein n=1 Tax=Clostridium algidicarnis TaxID=37659 RepID=UPI001C0BF2F5|nr:hypothetical protein [Clostridium algidicarnis]MBU3205238.1 hypothetical protein [Clostridium algidicarnis]MBU3213391.1 hypothetical protein [Clostridium algidicarnis]MBU3223334.1 hypothetical protein [Clostridium algidicarnis]
MWINKFKLKRNNKVSLIKRTFLCFIIVFAFISVLSVKFNKIGTKLLDLNNGDYYYGDLYELSKLNDFKDKIPVDKKKLDDISIYDSDIITMGDSFLEANLGSATLPYLLNEAISKKVYHLSRNDFLKYNDNPITFLKSIDYKKGDKKYLVLETVERYALERSVSYVEAINTPSTVYETGGTKSLDTALNVSNSSSAGISPIKNHSYKNIIAKIKGAFDSNKFDYFFYNNKLFSPIDKLNKNFRFKLLDEVEKTTPKYSTDPGMLFYVEDVNFNNLDIQSEPINMFANNIARLQDTLLEDYNIELIFVLIPTKYSIYGKYTKDYKLYNDFIPRSYKELNKHNINTFDTYNLFINEDSIEDDLLYYKGDSHFTPRGKNLVLKHILALF